MFEDVISFAQRCYRLDYPSSGVLHEMLRTVVYERDPASGLGPNVVIPGEEWVEAPS